MPDPNTSLQPVAAIDLLIDARGHLDAGLLFDRVGVPCDERDTAHFRTALAILVRLIESQRHPFTRAHPNSGNQHCTVCDVREDSHA